MYYDFVEIGTADFDTLVQQADDLTVGLSVDPVKVYLDRLPTKPLCKKDHCAVSNRDGDIDVYYVIEDVISTHNLTPLLRGCSQVGALHPVACQILRQNGLDPSLCFAKEIVPLKSFNTLRLDHRIEGIHVLKVDAEGHDCVILRHYLNVCKIVPSLFADIIQFESNMLTSEADVEVCISEFQAEGYQVRKIARDDTLMVRLRLL